MNKILTDILNYKNYLERLGIEVSLCLANDTLYPRLGLMIGDFLHRSPFCAYVKSDEGARLRCIHKQVALRDKMLSGEDRFSGCCHAGMHERVYRVGSDRFVGFLSVSGLGGDTSRTRRRIERLSEGTSLDSRRLSTYMLDSITPASQMDEEMIDTLVMPLVRMLETLALSREATDVVDRVVAYVDSHYHEDIKIEDLARMEKYSVSRLSHVFSQSRGMSIGEYIKQVRMDIARDLLANTSMQIGDVASHVGYMDADYFSRVFTRSCGKSPRKYRQTCKKVLKNS
ncbi:MAG: helix-turn-helix transcriptional regulator [Clostridia bacterium]|nr:helix-turn-helix transcriptional regulator [Clostridia bacterium]